MRWVLFPFAATTVLFVFLFTNMIPWVVVVAVAVAVHSWVSFSFFLLSPGLSIVI